MDRQDNPRFEFRLFGNTMNQALEQVVQTTALKRTERQRDLYVLSVDNSRYNIKIRDNRLNTKVLMRCQEGLERWHPHFDMAFPLSAAFLREMFFPLLAVSPVTFDRTTYSLEAFQQELIQPHPNLRMVPVHKQRHHYQVAGPNGEACQLEVAILYIDNRFYTHTIALEAVHANTVQQLRARLDLLTAKNVNYHQGLKQLLAGDWAESYTFSFAERVGFYEIGV